MSAQQALAQRVAEMQRRHPPADGPGPQRHFNGPPATVLRQDTRLCGVALKDARVRTEKASGNTLLIVLLKQTFSDLPVLAVRRYDGSAASLTAAHNKASRLRAGTVVQATGGGFRLSRHQGQQVIELLFVQSIEPPQEVITRKDLE